MSILGLIILFTVISGVLAMVGGAVLLGRPGLVRRFSLHFISFAAGALLAVAFLDLLPEAVELTADGPEGIFIFILIGILAMFLLERLIFNFHYHYYEGEGAHRHAAPILLLIGDGIHNFVDGVIIASAFLVDPSLGVVTAVGVAAHELPQEIADFSIMLAHGWSRAAVFWSNFGVALTAVVGGVIAYSARTLLTPYLPVVLALTAGIFIYIATSDLFPEIDPETAKDKTSHVLILLLLGIAAVYLAGQVELGLS